MSKPSPDDPLRLRLMLDVVSDQRNAALDNCAALSARIHLQQQQVDALQKQNAVQKAEIETLQTRLIPGEGGQS
jgi:hypothetical protein